MKRTLVICAALLCALGMAQVSAAAGVRGYVKRILPTNALKAVPGVTVSFWLGNSEIPYKATTDGKGYYKAGLPAGLYRVEINKKGYKLFGKGPLQVKVPEGTRYKRFDIKVVGKPMLKPGALKKPKPVFKPKMFGYRGVVRCRMDNGSLAGPIPGAKIHFEREDGKFSADAVSKPNGRYQIRLIKGRYVVTATANTYHPFSTSPGFFVYKGKDWQTGNIFMKRDWSMVPK